MSSRVCNSTQCVFSLARKLDSELALRMSFGSEFHTFAAATQNARLAVSVRVHGTDAEHRWTAETASSLSVVGVRRCTAEPKSTEPYLWWPLFFTGCAGVTLVAVWRWHACAADRWPGRRCYELSAASRWLQQGRHTAVSCSSRFVTRWRCRQWSAPFQ